MQASPKITIHQITIHRGGPQDAAAIALALHESFVEYEALYTREGFAATVLNADLILSRMQEGPVWIAWCEHRVLGTAAAVLKGKSAYMRGMAVLPAARGARVGARLLEQVEHWASNQGCCRVFLSTTPFLSAAIRLYERSGFRRTDEGPNDLFGTPLFTMEKDLVVRG
jgi:GNAT superfamily N-acetyltransferase